MIKKLQESLMSELTGVITGHRDGHGFFRPDDQSGDVFIPPNEMRAVLHGDRVQVRVTRFDKRGRPEGRVTQILSRSDRPIIGRLLHEGNVYLVAPEDKRYSQDVMIVRQGLNGAKVGQVVVVELTEPPALYGQPVGRVKEILGEIDDPGMEIEIAVRKYGVPHLFSVENDKQTAALPDKVRAADKKGRVDLTDVPLVTIDGEDARDFDDAVYCEPVKVGRTKGWRLLVAIADVSHYVRPGDAIDQDAFDRATSVYFPRRVIPMLPEKLSNGLCSLNPFVERLCMVADMLITAQGEVHAYQFYPAVMYSHARFTYTQVASILQSSRSPEALEHEALVPHLYHLHDVYRALLQARQARGAIDFETTETRIVSDENGRIIRIEPRERNDAHRLIEEAMLAANVCAADLIIRSKKPGLYRVHEGPTPDRLNILKDYLKAIGMPAQLSDDPTPADYQVLSAAARERPDAQAVQTMLLRSMQQAIYTPHNSGHFGLSYEAYTHFTSPIRRYPDLMVHRVIKSILQGNSLQLPRLAGNVPEGLAWESIGLQCSANERRADEASKDVELWLKCKYMRDHLGEEYEGRVTGVTSFGLFVTLDSLFVEGMIHITELGSEYFRFDETRHELRGERTGIRYHLGAPVRIQVSRVDLDGRRIDFRMIPSSHAPAASTSGDKLSSVGRERRGASARAEKNSVSKSSLSRKAAATASKGPRAVTGKSAANKSGSKKSAKRRAR